MEKNSKEKLDKLIKRNQEKLARGKKLQDDIQSEEDELLRKFYEVRKGIIRPAMEEVGEYIKSNGHDYRISERDESTDYQGRTQDANISMSIFPGGIKSASYTDTQTPRISFFATKYKKIIWGHRSDIMPGRGGSAGSFAEFKPEEIKRDMVEKEILTLLEKIF